MDPDDSIATGRAKRQKLDKKGRFAALEKLKSLKGSKNKYEIGDVTNVYDEVDEREYSKKVLSRQEDDWIVDDGGGGYVEDGREIFDDDLDEESVAESSKRKSKKRKPGPEKPKASNGTIQSMFANMPTKKKEAKADVNADELLESLIGEMDCETPQKPTISSKDYLKSFTRAPVVRQKPVTPKITTSAVKRKKSPSPSPVPARKALIGKYNDEPKVEESKIESNEKITQDEAVELTPASTFNDTSEVIDIGEPSHLEDDFNATDDFGDFSVDDFVPDTPKDPEKISALKQKIDVEGPVQFDDDWNSSGKSNNIESSIAIDSSTIPLTTNEEGEQIFRFFWWDAYEDPYKQPGNIYMFGKVYVESAKTYASCCLVVRNIPRRIFLLPREKKINLSSNSETEDPVTFLDVYKEFNDKVANTHKIMNFKSRKVVRKYAFDLTDVPAESEYLEVKYPATFPKLSADLKGETFSRIFGTNTSALEIFLLERKIKGPCWLDVRAPQTASPSSWCKLELACNAPEDVTVSTVTDSPPPLTIMAINVRTVLNNRNMQNEVVMFSCLVHTKFMVDKPAPSPNFEQHFCAFTRPSDVPWPMSLKKEMAAYRGTRLFQQESERSLLGFLLTKLFLLDPDLIVGHDLYGFTLDTLMHRIEHYKVPNWSRVGRLKRGNFLQIKGKSADRQLICGRLVCDTMISARELIRARSYDLDTLAKQVLKVPENKRQDFTSEEVKGMFCQPGGLTSLINATMQDTSFALRLMYELNVVPLALQITNIAGNLMARTLLGGRSERNEYLLLHAFTEKEFIVPDKVYGKRKSEAEGDETKSKRKPEYAGGLVLEPKKGFYDKYILLMDFNSLYPSIIQEYNICFTTVTRTVNSDQEPELPVSGLPLGILPIEIRKLVESRRKVKNLMKTPDLSSELQMQYNIRQTALKLTANSMYGCLGFAYSRFYAKPLAALVTSRGREILMNTKDVVQKMNFDVIYGDTDSIMINTNCMDYEQVFSIGHKIKQEINKLYKHVELEVDGVFKYMLLLKKKKYAAVVLNKKPSGDLVATQEYKGLDIVRRDWSQLSAEIGRFVLNQILSDAGPDERVEAIRTQLEKVAQDLKNNEVPVALLAITKQLAKNPEDYPDKKSLPHLQVAMRINSKGGKKLKAGDTVSYVICDDGTNQAAVQRAYHVDELKGNEKLLIDVNYYLAQQIHPVVSRLCEPVDGLDAAFIAECLGLDPTSYRRAVAKRAQTEEGDDDDCAVADDMQFFKFCDKFSFKCVNEECKTVIEMEGPVHDNYLVLSRCRNTACTVPPTEYLASIKNSLQLAIRNYVGKLYENWLICEDPACDNRTRRVPMEMVNAFPVCRLCGKGLMYREYRNPDLYYQLKYFAHMFNLKSVKLHPSPVVADAYKTLADQVEVALNQSAYRIIDFSKIFKFALNNNRPKISKAHREMIDVQKKMENV